jgi:hypothetical protein
MTTQKPIGRPWAFTSVWVEVVNGKISGEYEITTQGANIYGFVYKSLRSGKSVSFYQDSEAHGQSGCEWR